MSDLKGESFRKGFPASFFISEFLGLSGRVFGSSRKAFLLLLLPDKRSPRRTGDERKSKQATAQPAKKMQQHKMSEAHFIRLRA
ncbi:hypothetical protein [Flavobacterium sp.]|uniref:hypothetical protein n=1 Tax=Flavobacterium sp. TaxID=239 RepID=UPI0012150A78|nr:hypothetical protein [Flavobacterium sp.]RZJ68930.1 MAG: hypothetical protein EOO49_19060 [Flavobacterium sp.]